MSNHLICLNQANYHIKITVILLLMFVVCGYRGVSQNILINEMLSSNHGGINDIDGDDSDWIEIYNCSENPVRLGRFYLSDKKSNLKQWQFPDTLIEPNEYLLVFASGKNRRTPGQELHTNFSLKASGEELFLSTNDTIIHAVPPIALDDNVSYGLSPDGGTRFVLFETPTPGESNSSSQSYDKVSFSAPGGIYPNPFLVRLYCMNAENQIYYTINGTTPDTHAQLYDQAGLFLDSSLYSQENICQVRVSPMNLHHPPVSDIPHAIVIRAAVFDPDGQRLSRVVTHTYFVKSLGFNNMLPVLSICADHGDLFDEKRGIFVPGIYWDESNPDWTGNYYQKGDEWERTINAEFYESNNSGFNQICGLRTHGGNCRRLPQKGMRLYARSEYGSSHFEHPVFTDKDISQFKRLVLKPFSSSWSQSGLEDNICNQLVKNLQCDGISSRPAVVYINGEYWGIYYIEEKIDEDYVEENFGYDGDQVNVIGNWWGMVEEGNNTDFLNLFDFVDTHSMADSANYSFVSGWMDMDNFIDYQLFEIFIGNSDWPANNMKCWNSTTQGKWRWIFVDGDATLQNPSFDTFNYALAAEDNAWSVDPKATLFLRKLLKNSEFKEKFFHRLEQLLNQELSVDQTISVYNSSLAYLDKEIDNQINRFNFPESFSYWSESVNLNNSFLSSRALKIQELVTSHFGENLNITSFPTDLSCIKDLMVYPNPNQGSFTIRFSSGMSQCFMLYFSTITGKVIRKDTGVAQQGDNRITYRGISLPAGIIMIYLVTENGRISVQMISSH